MKHACWVHFAFLKAKIIRKSKLYWWQFFFSRVWVITEAEKIKSYLAGKVPHRVVTINVVPLEVPNLCCVGTILPTYRKRGWEKTAIVFYIARHIVASGIVGLAACYVPACESEGIVVYPAQTPVPLACREKSISTHENNMTCDPSLVRKIFSELCPIVEFFRSSSQHLLKW